MIIFTPTKTMKKNYNVINGTMPIYQKESQYLRDSLCQLSKEELGDVLKIANKTLELTYDYYHNNYEQTVAIDLYDGISYKQITTYDSEYLQNNVTIISALYGPLRATDVISPYRLDFHAKKFIAQNLYQYWYSALDEYFSSQQIKTVLNLASNEYSKTIKQLNSEMQIIDLEFTMKINSTQMKKYRGMLLNYCIVNKITDYQKLVGVDFTEFAIDSLENNKLIINIK